MSQTLESGYRTDIHTCDEEPIHLISHIQSHGYLICVSKETYNIEYVSENIIHLFKLKDLLGKNIAVIDNEIGNKLLTDLLNVQFRSENVGTYNPYQVELNDKHYNIISHFYQNHAILEFEPAASEVESKLTQKTLGEIMIKLMPSSGSLNELMQDAAKYIKELLSFDRVMVYQFHEDWHGHVIAEAREESLEPYLGLHYPASDIPKQARELYKKNLTRLISDVDSNAVPVLSHKKEPLDMTLSQLRSVSPMHIEYMKNMGVKASYSISLLKDNELWGLISCHHYQPKFIDYEKRKSSEIISQYLSTIISVKLEHQNDVYFKNNIEIINVLDEQMRRDWDIAQGLTAHETNVVDLFDGNCAALVYDRKITTVGNCPSDDKIRAIVDWIHRNQSMKKVYKTTNISKHIPEATADCKICSGVMAFAISHEMKEYILFFKPEKIENVDWAGEKAKEQTIEADGSIRFSPRKSFDKWTEEVKYTSEPWKDWEVKAAMDLLEKIASIVQLKSNEIRRLNDRLNIAYQELDTFSYTLSHDLKTPLNTIRGYIELYLEEINESVEENPLFSKVVSSIQLMENMISSILKYSKLSREELELKEVNLYDIVEDVTEQVSIGKKFSAFENTLPESITVKGNDTMLFQVFLNLIDNAVKYSSSKKDAFVKIYEKSNNENVIIYIEDNGIGMEPQYHDSIFNLFSRIPATEKIEGTGVGLAITKRIMDKHKADIDVTSKYGEGTVFKLTFNN